MPSSSDLAAAHSSFLVQAFEVAASGNDAAAVAAATGRSPTCVIAQVATVAAEVVATFVSEDNQNKTESGGAVLLVPPLTVIHDVWDLVASAVQAMASHSGGSGSPSMLVALPVVAVTRFADCANSVAPRYWTQTVLSALLSSAAHEVVPNSFADTHDDDRAVQPVAY